MQEKMSAMKKKGRISQKEKSRLGGLARAKKLDPERRHQIASSAGRVSAKNRKIKNTKNDKNK